MVSVYIGFVLFILGTSSKGKISSEIDHGVASAWGGGLVAADDSAGGSKLSDFASSKQQQQIRQLRQQHHTFSQNNGSSQTSTSLSQSQQLAGLISRLFRRSSSAAPAKQSQGSQHLETSPEVFSRQYDSQQTGNGWLHLEPARQDSADYEEMLYQLNSFIPEGLLSSDALCLSFDDSLDEFQLSNSAEQGGDATRGRTTAESTMREHTHWSRQLHSSAPAVPASVVASAGAEGEVDYILRETSTEYVSSLKQQQQQQQPQDEERAEEQDNLSELEAQQRTSRQSALSLSWLNKCFDRVLSS